MNYMGIHCVVNVHVLYGYTLCGECACIIWVYIVWRMYMYYMCIHYVVNVHVLYGYTLCGECTCIIWVYIVW